MWIRIFLFILQSTFAHRYLRDCLHVVFISQSSCVAHVHILPLMNYWPISFRPFNSSPWGQFGLILYADNFQDFGYSFITLSAFLQHVKVSVLVIFCSLKLGLFMSSGGLLRMVHKAQQPEKSEVNSNRLRAIQHGQLSTVEDRGNPGQLSTVEVCGNPGQMSTVQELGNRRQLSKSARPWKPRIVVQSARAWKPRTTA